MVSHATGGGVRRLNGGRNALLPSGMRLCGTPRRAPTPPLTRRPGPARRPNKFAGPTSARGERSCVRVGAARERIPELRRRGRRPPCVLRPGRYDRARLWCLRSGFPHAEGAAGGVGRGSGSVAACRRATATWVSCHLLTCGPRCQDRRGRTTGEGRFSEGGLGGSRRLERLRGGGRATAR